MIRTDENHINHLTTCTLCDSALYDSLIDTTSVLQKYIYIFDQHEKGNFVHKDTLCCHEYAQFMNNGLRLVDGEWPQWWLRSHYTYTSAIPAFMNSTH